MSANSSAGVSVTIDEHVVNLTNLNKVFWPGEGITKGALSVKATVPGIEAAAFNEAAETAKQNCPVSKALAGIPEVSLDASLA